MSKRTLIFIIKLQYQNTEGESWGFGDLLKGLIHTHQLSKKYNFELYVDFQFHPLSKYFKSIEHPFKDFIHYNHNNARLMNGRELENYIIATHDHNVIQLMCNQIYSENVSDECKQFIKNNFIPNDSLQTYIETKLSKIPYSSYNIIHYRIGDHEMFHGVVNSNIYPHYHNYMINIHLSKKDNTILLSDSKSFKEYVKKYTHIFMFDDNPTHIGISDNLYDSLADFFIITKATNITSYSIYDWESGFIKVPADVYGIPVIFNKLC